MASGAFYRYATDRLIQSAKELERMPDSPEKEMLRKYTVYFYKTIVTIIPPIPYELFKFIEEKRKET